MARSVNDSGGDTAGSRKESVQGKGVILKRCEPVSLGEVPGIACLGKQAQVGYMQGLQEALRSLCSCCRHAASRQQRIDKKEEAEEHCRCCGSVR